MVADVFVRDAVNIIHCSFVVHHDAARPPLYRDFGCGRLYGGARGFGCGRLYGGAIDTKNSIALFKFVHGRRARTCHNVGRQKGSSRASEGAFRLVGNQTQTLRRSLPEGTTMSTIKNKLMLRALEGTEYESAASLVKGPNTWFFIQEDISGTIKAFSAFTRLLDLSRLFLPRLHELSKLRTASLHEQSSSPEKLKSRLFQTILLFTSYTCTRNIS